MKLWEKVTGLSNNSAFGIWVTGPPASGKSTLTAALKEQLRGRGVDVAVLESEALRKTVAPHSRNDEKERDTFYQQMADVGVLLTGQGVPVIFDATANQRASRDRARQQIPYFLEIYVECPSIRGLQTEYEPPETPHLVLHCKGESAEAAAQRVVALLSEKGYIR